MDKQLVSILVPIYNGQKFLTEFLDSIKKQTYRPIELILRDDCSKDASVNLCEKWKENNAECDFTINLIKGEKNIGLSQNVAKLAQYARGKFIFLADQDDIWLKDKVLEQVEYSVVHSLAFPDISHILQYLSLFFPVAVNAFVVLLSL